MRYEKSDIRYETWDIQYGLTVLRCRIRDMINGISDIKYEIWDVKYGILSNVANTMSTNFSFHNFGQVYRNTILTCAEIIVLKKKI